MLLFISRRPPTSPTLFPYTTLFRSHAALAAGGEDPCDDAHRRALQVGVGKDDVGRLATQLEGDRDEALAGDRRDARSEEHTSELQSPCNLVCRLLLEKKNNRIVRII